MVPFLCSHSALIPTLALLLRLSMRTMILHGPASSPVQLVAFFTVQSHLSVVPTRILVALSIRRVLVSVQIDRSFPIPLLFLLWFLSMQFTVNLLVFFILSF